MLTEHQGLIFSRVECTCDKCGVVLARDIHDNLKALSKDKYPNQRFSLMCPSCFFNGRPYKGKRFSDGREYQSLLECGACYKAVNLLDNRAVKHICGLCATTHFEYISPAERAEKAKAAALKRRQGAHDFSESSGPLSSRCCCGDLMVDGLHGAQEAYVSHHSGRLTNLPHACSGKLQKCLLPCDFELLMDLTLTEEKIPKDALRKLREDIRKERSRPLTEMDALAADMLGVRDPRMHNDHMIAPVTGVQVEQCTECGILRTQLPIEAELLATETKEDRMEAELRTLGYDTTKFED